MPPHAGRVAPAAPRAMPQPRGWTWDGARDAAGAPHGFGTQRGSSDRDGDGDGSGDAEAADDECDWEFQGELVHGARADARGTLRVGALTYVGAEWGGRHGGAEVGRACASPRAHSLVQADTLALRHTPCGHGICTHMRQHNVPALGRLLSRAHPHSLAYARPRALAPSRACSNARSPARPRALAGAEWRWLPYDCLAVGRIARWGDAARRAARTRSGARAARG